MNIYQKQPRRDKQECDMKLAVTGSAGIIGSAFLWKLNKEGINDIFAVDVFSIRVSWWAYHILVKEERSEDVIDGTDCYERSWIVPKREFVGIVVIEVFDSRLEFEDGREEKRSHDDFVFVLFKRFFFVLHF